MSFSSGSKSIRGIWCFIEHIEISNSLWKKGLTESGWELAREDHDEKAKWRKLRIRSRSSAATAIYSSKKSKPRYFTYSFRALSSPVCWDVPLQGQGSGLQLLHWGVHFGAPLACHPTSPYCGKLAYKWKTTRMELILPRPCHPNLEINWQGMNAVLELRTDPVTHK